MTAVGDDDLGKRALDLYRRQGIDISHIRIVAGVSSGVALIFVDDDGENMIGVASGANHMLTQEDIDRLPDSLFRAGDVLLAGLEIPLETAARAIQRGARAGMRDPPQSRPRPFKPRRHHARPALPRRRPHPQPPRGTRARTNEPGHHRRTRLERMRRPYAPVRRARAVVITLGADGCLVATPSVKRNIPAPQVDAVDTVGAGDAFNGALAVALSENRSLEAAAAWATAAAALAVTQPGAQAALPYRDAIDKLTAARCDDKK